MCEFLDETGAVLQPGDAVEYWSPSYKEWKKAKVLTIESSTQMKRVRNERDGEWEDRVVTETKIFVAKEYTPGKYQSYNAQRLTKTSNIRKLT